MHRRPLINGGLRGILGAPIVGSELRDTGASTDAGVYEIQDHSRHNDRARWR